LADLLTVREARFQILTHFKPVGTTRIAFDQGLARVLAESIIAREDIPFFPNSSMDGYAVRSADLARASQDQPVFLPVAGEIPAGRPDPITLQPGQAIRIMTGALLPDGADAIVPIEEVSEVSTQAGAPVIEFRSGAYPGQYIRPKGQDLHAGDVIFQSGRRLSATDLGLLASLGITELLVYERPRVALISSGDELIQPTEPLVPGKIRDANSYLLAALLAQNGIQVVPLGIAPDQFEAIQVKLGSAVGQQVDLIVTSAGVSVGTYDFVRAVIESRGKMEFWRVNIRPGKPIAFGAYRGVPIIGLPGNPVSAYVGFEVFVKPVLGRLSGQAAIEPQIIPVKLREEIKSDGRESYLRAKVKLENGIWQASLIGHQGSGNLRALTDANALLIVPSGVKSLPAESVADAWLLNSDFL